MRLLELQSGITMRQRLSWMRALWRLRWVEIAAWQEALLDRNIGCAWCNSTSVLQYLTSWGKRGVHQRKRSQSPHHQEYSQMAIDDHGVDYCCSHCYWSRGWDLASPQNNQVLNIYRTYFFLAYSYSPAAPQNPKITPHPNITRVAQYILNDTSLAALFLANGDRQQFFQDNTGLIRRAVRTASNSQWSTSPYLSVNFNNAKNNTPLAVNVPFGSDDSVDGSEPLVRHQS